MNLSLLHKIAYNLIIQFNFNIYSQTSVYRQTIQTNSNSVNQIYVKEIFTTQN